MSTSVSVIYTFVDGAHFFTTEDKEWCGLCAASTDLKAAWNDVAVQLNELAWDNQGIKTNFQPKDSVENFAKKMIDHLTTKIRKINAKIAELEADLAKIDHDQGKDTVVPAKHLGVKPKGNVIWAPEAQLAA